MENILNSLPKLKKCVLLCFIYSLKEMIYNLIGFSQDTIFEVDVKIHFPYTCTYDFGDIPLMMRNSQIFITGIHQLLAQIFAICIKLLTSGINFLLLNDNLLHNTLFTNFGGDHIIVIWLIFILSLHLLLKVYFFNIDWKNNHKVSIL